MRRTAEKIVRRWCKLSVAPALDRWVQYKGEMVRLSRAATKMVRRWDKMHLWTAFAKLEAAAAGMLIGPEGEAVQRVRLGGAAAGGGSAFTLPLPGAKDAAKDAEDRLSRGRAVGMAAALVKELAEACKELEAEIGLESRDEGFSYEYEDWVPRLCGECSRRLALATWPPCVLGYSACCWQERCRGG